jgi:hypothetical protein
MAIDAGIDLLVFADKQAFDPNVARDTVDTIADLVHSGHVSDARASSRLPAATRLEGVRAPG